MKSLARRVNHRLARPIGDGSGCPLACASRSSWGAMIAMKRVEALIRPERLEAVKIALSEAEVTGLNVSTVVGRGEMPPEERRAGRAGETVLVDLLPKLKLETIVSDWNVENVIEVIREHGGIGDLGDGLIFVSDIGEAISIRTGERGNDTL